VAALTALAAISLGCGDATTASKSNSTPSSASSASSEPWASGEATAPSAPTITRPEGDPPSELLVDDIKPGDGSELIDGQLAIVNYIGANWSDGAVFDSSFDGSPFGVIVGTGSVIKGWDQGLVGMKVGGTRQLVIPPDLGYGEQAQGKIGANETLIFVIELLAARSRPKPAPAPGPIDQLEIIDVEAGTGDRALKAGDQALVHYSGVLASNGEEFDSSWTAGEPFQLQAGVGAVIKGWDDGLIGMKPGGRRRLVIPADLAYGATGSPPSIGPNEPLVFEVDLIALA